MVVLGCFRVVGAGCRVVAVPVVVVALETTVQPRVRLAHSPLAVVMCGCLKPGFPVILFSLFVPL